MNGRIFLLDEQSSLTPMTESPYDSEDLLQRLLSEHADLLAGDQMNPDQPRRWQLVTREMGIPGEEEGSNRWSVDHLFLDDAGVPTLVEVKRSKDSRIRREVVGQMLDYAANAVAYWPIEEIRARFEARCERDNLDPGQTIDEFIGPESDESDFWQRVKTNLQAGRIRMIFVADVIPTELRRVVEFLNEQMDPAEVLAIEVRQFVGEGLRTLVPRLFGQTESAKAKKSQTNGERAEKITAESFLESLDVHQHAAGRRFARELLEWAHAKELRLSFNLNKRHASFIPILEAPGRTLYPLSVWDTGEIWIQMRWLKAHPPFASREMREELQRQMCELPGFSMSDAGMEGFPKLSISQIQDEGDSRRILSVLSWIVDQCREASG